jgi:uncharacterized cupredoxin-like copper-binding protein
MKLRALLPLTAFVLLAACGNDSAASGADLVVVAREFEYAPASLALTAGEATVLALTNKGSIEHDFTIQAIPLEGAAAHDARPSADGDPVLRLRAQPGQTTTLEFTPTEPGTYEFFCKLPGHRSAGMEGTLEVVANS